MVIYKRTPFYNYNCYNQNNSKMFDFKFYLFFLHEMTEDIKVYLMTNFGSHWTLFLVIIANNNRTIGLFGE